MIVGTGAQSTKEAVELAIQAAECGGDYIIALPPNYFSGSLTTAALESFYREVRSLSEVFF